MCSETSGIDKVFAKDAGRKGVSPFSVKKLLTHSAEKICRGNLLCFWKFLVSNVFMDDRYGGRERGSITFFCQKFVVSLYRNTP